MKKYLSLSIALVLIVPSVTFAAWWNPISWFGNWSFSGNPDAKTQVLENRINELEKKLSGTATLDVPTITDNADSASTTSEPTYQGLLKAKQEKASAIRAALGVASSTQSTKFYVKYNNSRIRSCASTEGCDVVGYYNKNGEITISGDKPFKLPDLKDWIQISTSNGVSGYISKSVLSEVPVTIASPVKQNVTTDNSTTNSQVNTPIVYNPDNVVVSNDDAINIKNSLQALIVKRNKRVSDSESFLPTIYTAMASSPNNQSYQQAGNNIIDNETKHNSVLRKITEMDTITINKISSKLESNRPVTDRDLPTPEENRQQKAYLEQDTQFGNNVEPLIQTFVNIKVADLKNQAANLTAELNAKTQLDNAIVSEQARLSAINQARVEQYNIIRANGSREGLTEAVVNAQLNAAGLIKQINCYTSPVGGKTPSGGSITCY
jgi:hypothetical protein